MTTEIEVHPIQTKILKVLLFKKEARFSQLNQTDLTNDHFSFHINQLVDLGLVEKMAKGKYRLTPKGKEFANRMDTEKEAIERQAKESVLIVCARKTGSIRQYLFSQRLKQPYYGFYGFVSGKIRWGEKAIETATRELKEETGLTGKLTFCGIEHKMDYSVEGKVLEDKFFFIYKATNLRGKLITEFEGGRNIWLSEREIRKTPNLFKDVIEIISLIKSRKIRFFENQFTETIY